MSTRSLRYFAIAPVIAVIVFFVIEWFMAPIHIPVVVKAVNIKRVVVEPGRAGGSRIFENAVVVLKSAYWSKYSLPGSPYAVDAVHVDDVLDVSATPLTKRWKQFTDRRNGATYQMPFAPADFSFYDWLLFIFAILLPVGMVSGWPPVTLKMMVHAMLGWTPVSGYCLVHFLAYPLDLGFSWYMLFILAPFTCVFLFAKFGFDPRGCLHSTKYVYILVFWGGPRWFASCCETTNGGALNGWWQAKKVIRAALDGITGYSWRRCYGLPGQVVPGAICRASSVVGTRRTFASHVGASAGCGSAWRRFSMAMLTWNNCLLTLPSFEPTNMRLAPKKRRRSGDRALARRTEHQGAHRGGCVGQSTAADSERWTDRRYRPCRRPDCLYPRQGNHRRQGLRCPSFDPGLSSQRGAGGYPGSFQPQGTQALRYPSVQGSQSHRAILRSHQAISAHCHSVRQARSQLYGILASSLHLRLARLNVNSP